MRSEDIRKMVEVESSPGERYGACNIYEQMSCLIMARDLNISNIFSEIVSGE